MKNNKLFSRFVLAPVAILLFVALLSPSPTAAVTGVFINEIHYDNNSTDMGEAIEVAGPAGTDLTGWTIVRYNGNGGASYGTDALPSTIPDQCGGYGTVVVNYPSNGLQNGSPDGMALVDGSNTVVQFLSYEGSFAATDGPANGMTSTDIGVSEPSTTTVGDSLQLTGTGTNDVDFTWNSPAPNSFGSCNPGQTFGGGGGSGPADPLINEFVANHTGSDTQAFIEVLGDPSADYSAFTVLEIEGDGSGAGIVDAVLPVTSTDAGGYWTDPEDMENGTITILLVEGFTGAGGDDLDTDNDGAFDSTPWTRIADDVAVTDGGTGDQTYSSSVLAPFYDGQPFGAGGASRIPNGTDTDSASDWVRNDFDGFGFPGFPGSPALGEAENTPGAANVAITVLTDPVGACGDPATMIFDIQGAGLASSDVGSIREIEGVVVGDFQGSSNMDGFFVQEEDAEADGDSQTSDGIFVFDGSSSVDVSEGDVVRVRGSVAEYFGMTELIGGVSVAVCGGTGTASAASMSLPVSSLDDWEPVEGMLVTIAQPLYISEFFNFDRFGEIVLTAERQYQPTAVYEPGSPEAAQLAADNLLARITLDDGRTSQNPDPAIHPNGNVFDLTNLFRGGDTVANVTGVVNYSFSLYRIQPTKGADYTPANPRPSTPDNVGGSLKVASFNVLNYFLTLDDSGPVCGPGLDQGCRGADNATELARQRAKIISATVDIDADIYGLIEMENTTGVEPLQDLVDGMNAEVGAGTYDYIDTGTIGTDAIRVGFIYNTTTVAPVNGYAILDSSVDSRFIDTLNRPALAQTFYQFNTDGMVTVVVNHLKSKGSACDAVGDPDTGDGAGNCNLTRKAAAEALVDWLATDPTGSGTDNVLVIGDLNSYDKEDPIDALVNGGYADLLLSYQGEFAYSYVFDGQLGYLDHALANGTLAPAVTGAAAWHINADEPDILDYDTSFKQDAQDALYEPNAYRASDHDPVIVGLDLGPIITADGCYVLALQGSPFTGQANQVPFSHPSVKLVHGEVLFSAPRWAHIEGLPIISCFEVHGTNQPDFITTGILDDALFGYGGNDFLNGRPGDDTFTGGPGRDWFLGTQGYDTVTDYQNHVDRCLSIEQGCG